MELKWSRLTKEDGQDEQDDQDDQEKIVCLTVT
jgi:hypothetical protein